MSGGMAPAANESGERGRRRLPDSDRAGSGDMKARGGKESPGREDESRPREDESQGWEDKMKVALGSDHAGYALKLQVEEWLRRDGHEVIDEGTFSERSCDYPDFALGVARRVAGGEAERGIAICATGIGMAMAANKVPGIRAAVCNDIYTARYSRLHNDANVLALGARVVGPGVAEEIVRTWMETPFEGGRHSRRLEKIAGIEGAREGEEGGRA